MSMISHICERTDCEHNHTGTHVCGFFVGDVYFVDCLRNATMYKKKTKQPKEQPTDSIKMKAFIYFNGGNKDYSGEGEYLLMTEDGKCIGSHYCSSRGFANHDLTEWRLEELQENNISEVYSDGELVWKENKHCNH